MATSRALPDGGQSSAATHRSSAPKVSARKGAASEATLALTPTGKMPRSKSSAKAEKGAGFSLTPKKAMPPSQDTAGHKWSDTQSPPARNGDGQHERDTHCVPAVSESSASHNRSDTHDELARSKGGRRAPLKDSSGQTVLGTQKPFAGEGGPPAGDTHHNPAAQDLAGQPRSDAQITVACEGEGLSVSADLQTDALPQLLTEIRLHHRLRQDYQRARQKLGQQLLAMCCRSFGYSTLDADVPRKKALAEGAKLLALAKKGKADPGFQANIAPMIAAFDLVSAFEKQQTKTLEAQTDHLPAAILAWTDGNRGFGRLGLAQILGETGDLSLYSNPGKVWKRMGLAVFDGKSQRKCTDKAKAAEQGYAPSRRSIMHVIGVSLICQNKDYLRQVYDAEKLRQEQLYPHLTVGHRDKKARRYMQKRLLRDLWREWRAASFISIPSMLLPPSQDSGNGEGLHTADTLSPGANPIPEPEAA